jgi:hypothetical protein
VITCVATENKRVSRSRRIFTISFMCLHFSLKAIAGETPEKFHAFCGTLMYIIVFNRLEHRTLPILILSSHYTYVSHVVSSL